MRLPLIQMHSLFKDRKFSLSDLKKTILEILNHALNGPVQIVNKDKVVAYVVSPMVLESLVEAAKKGGLTADETMALLLPEKGKMPEIGVSEHEGLEDSQKEMLISKATELLGSRQKAIEWLNSPRAAFSGKSPFEYAEKDVYEVIDYIGRLSHGVF